MLGKMICASIPHSSSTPRRTSGSCAPRCTSSWIHSMRARYELSLVPSRAMTPPALKRPTGWPSKTHIGWPSTSSTRGTRSRTAAGARLVKRSGASHQCESASMTSMSFNIDVDIRVRRVDGTMRRSPTREAGLSVPRRRPDWRTQSGRGGARRRNMSSVFDCDVDVNTGRCPRARGDDAAAPRADTGQRVVLDVRRRRHPARSRAAATAASWCIRRCPSARTAGAGPPSRPRCRAAAPSSASRSTPTAGCPTSTRPTSSPTSRWPRTPACT